MIEGGGQVYMPAPFNSTTAFAPWKSGVTYKGFGSSRPILDANWNEWGFNMSQGTNMTIDGIEFRNASWILMEINGVKGVDSNWTLKNSLLHHVDSTRGPVQTSSQPFNALLRVDWGTQHIINNVFHHCGHYNEAYGIFLDACKNTVVDGNVFYFIDKQSIRDYYSLYTQVINNSSFACEGGLDTMGFGSLIANNYINRSDYGIIAKHCNNVQFLSSVWGMTQAQLTNWTRFWHNTVYDSMGAHFEMAVSLTGTQPDYLEMTEARCNIFAGTSMISLYDQPAARKNTCYTDYNIHPTASKLGPFASGGGIYRRGFGASSWTILPDLAAMHSDSVVGSGATYPWEAHGQQLDPSFADVANNDFNPTVDYRAAITPQGIDGVPSPWGNQMGARDAVIAPAKWQHEPVITITGSAGSAAQLAKIVDDYGAITNVVMATQVEQLAKTAWIVCDLGSAKSISAFRWTPWSHNQWDNVQDFKIETASAPAGPWTTVLTSKIPDYGGVSRSWDLGGTYTARYWRFTALTNFIHGSGQTALIGGTSDRLLFAEVEWGNILTVSTAVNPPTNTALPTISGTAQEGNTFTATPGTWSNAVSKSYRWLRDGTTQVGTGLAYLLVAADVGHTMKVEETATGSTGLTATALSATAPTTGTITAAPPPPTSTRSGYWGIPA
jgi:hypothetical protein